MIIHDKFKYVFRALLGILFLFSATAKLIGIDAFEIYLFSFGWFSLGTAFLLARLVIVAEYVLGLLLLLLYNVRTMRGFERRLNEALDTADESVKEKKEFLSTMSHNIRNPLNEIIGLSVIARSKSDDSEMIDQCLLFCGQRIRILWIHGRKIHIPHFIFAAVDPDRAFFIIDLI